jgi:2-polyprenyl-3-methyl-5-hydroxy-6-metoxy-1,4-benzoquinol methylase
MQWDCIWKKKLKEKSPPEISDKLEIRYYNILESVFKNIIGNLKNKKVLEAGCGSGALSVRLAENGAKIYLVDESSYAIKYAKKIMKIKNVAGRVYQASIFSLPFPENFFDMVHSIGVIEHYKDDQILKILKEQKRVLKDNGIIIVGVPNIRNPQFLLYYITRLIKQCDIERSITEKKLITLLDNAGYKNIKIEYVPECIILSPFLKSEFAQKFLKFYSIIESTLLKPFGFAILAIAKKRSI